MSSPSPAERRVVPRSARDFGQRSMFQPSNNIAECQDYQDDIQDYEDSEIGTHPLDYSPQHRYIERQPHNERPFQSATRSAHLSQLASSSSKISASSTYGTKIHWYTYQMCIYSSSFATGTQFPHSRDHQAAIHGPSQNVGRIHPYNSRSEKNGSQDRSDHHQKGSNPRNSHGIRLRPVTELRK